MEVEGRILACAESPLMRLQYSAGLEDQLTSMLKLAIWLTSKGADICRKIPGCCASAGLLFGLSISLHLFFRAFSLTSMSRQEIQKVCLDILRNPDDRCSSFLFETLTIDNVDNCLCACSNRGCYVFTKILKALKKYIDANWGRRHRGLFVSADVVEIWCLKA